MTHTDRVTPWIFWAIVFLGLLWHAAGVFNYYVQTKPEMVATFPDLHRAMIENRPSWATGGFVVGVMSGLLACVLLLFRKSSAGILFLISLIGVFISTAYALQVMLARPTLAIGELFVIVILPLLVVNFYIAFTLYALRHKWI